MYGVNGAESEIYFKVYWSNFIFVVVFNPSATVGALRYSSIDCCQFEVIFLKYLANHYGVLKHAMQLLLTAILQLASIELVLRRFLMNLLVVTANQRTKVLDIFMVKTEI